MPSRKKATDGILAEDSYLPSGSAENEFDLWIAPGDVRR